MKTKATPRPPVVTIMGHVDHGKTTLLDTLRHSKLTAAEAGGITQSIGAYQVEHLGKSITFIDTPGHAAFSKMRQRGVETTDIVVLVVAADDGVKPQTRESVKQILKAKVPVVVAINKIDLNTASPEMVKAQLVEEGLAVEGYGGDAPVVEISARNNINLDKLLETILVMAEMEELTTTKDAPLQAIVIESAIVKNRGIVASVLVRSGELKLLDQLVAVDLPQVEGKVKRLTNDLGQAVKAAQVSEPVEVMGLKTLPPVGAILTNPSTLVQVSDLIKSKTDTQVAEPLQAKEVFPSKEETGEEVDKEVIEIKIILVADTWGSVEAIEQNLSDEVHILSKHTGQIVESDILLATASKAAVIAFRSSIGASAKKLAEVEQVPVRTYQVIYQLLEDFESEVLKLLEPTIDETVLGNFEVVQVFEIRGEVVAGGKVKTGKMSIDDRIHIKRNNKIITDSRIVSLKQGKVDVKSVEEGEECGLVLKPKFMLKAGDVLTSFIKDKK